MYGKYSSVGDVEGRKHSRYFDACVHTEGACWEHFKILMEGSNDSGYIF